MAMPDLSPTNYALKLCSKLEYCCDYGQTELNLTALGFAIRGDIGMTWGYKEIRPPLGVGAVAGGNRDVVEPYTLELVSELYATASPNDFHNEIHETIVRALHRAQTGIVDDTNVTYEKHKYLELGIYKTSSYQEYRLPVEIIGYELVPVWKSQLMIMQAVLRLRVVDPIWYSRGVGSHTWEVTNSGSGIPTGTQIVSGTSSMRRIKRFIIKFLYLGTGDVINPTIVNDKGETFTITGTLDTADQYWLVDMIEGRCYEGTAYSNQTDVTGAKFSGDFIGIDFTSTDSLIVTSPTDAGSITYNAYVEYVNAEM